MRRGSVAAVLAVVAFAAVFFARELTGSAVAVTSNMARWRPWSESATATEVAAPSHNPDSATSYYPRRFVLHEAWRRHAIPQWNPWTFCGAPYLADPQSEVLYPPSWPLAPLDPGVQLGVFLFLHAAFGGIGMTLLARRHGVPRDLAMLAGCAFAVNGFFAKHFGQPPFLAAASWIPWVLLAATSVASRPSVRGAAWLALAGAGMFLAGQPQIALWGGYSAALVAAVTWQGLPRPRPGIARALVLLAVAGAWAGALVAAQLLPTLDLAHRSARATLPWATVASGAFHPIDALRFACEELFGSPLTGDEWAWLFPRGDGFYLRTQINSVFAGTPVFLLALYGMVARSTRRAAAPFTVLFLAAVAIAFGTPLAALAYRVLPGFDFARLDRAGAFVVAAQYVPAALAAAALSRAAGWRRRAAGVALLAAAAAAFALVRLAGDDLPARLGASSTSLAGGFDPATLSRVPGRALVSLAFAASVGVALLLPAGRVAAWLPMAAACVQLFAGAAPYRGDRAPASVFPHAAGVETLRALLYGDDDGGGRFLRFGRDQPVRPYPISSVLPPSTNVPYRLRDLQGYNALSDRSLGEALERATGEPLFSWGIWSGRRIVEPVRVASLEHPLLDALAVRAVAGAALPVAAGWSPVPCHGFALARNDEALPRVSLAFAGRGIPADEMAARIAEGRMEPAREALWVGEGAVGAGGAAATDAKSVELVADDAELLLVRTWARTEAVLVVADSMDPGWTATLDGNPVPILPVWGLIRGVVVPAGPHLVEMRYRPPGWPAGPVVSLLALLAAGSVLAFVGVGRGRAGELTSAAPPAAGTL